MAGDNGCSGFRLPATDADGVVSRSDNRIALLSHHTQVSRLQLEMHFLARTRIEMNSFKSSKSNERSTLHFGELEIQLNHFISGDLAGIRNRDISSNRLPRSDTLLRHTQIAVAEFRVAEPIAKRIERLAGEVTIGAICHPVIFKIR